MANCSPHVLWYVCQSPQHDLRSKIKICCNPQVVIKKLYNDITHISWLTKRFFFLCTHFCAFQIGMFLRQLFHFHFSLKLTIFVCNWFFCWFRLHILSEKNQNVCYWRLKTSFNIWTLTRLGIFVYVSKFTYLAIM